MLGRWLSELQARRPSHRSRPFRRTAQLWADPKHAAELAYLRALASMRARLGPAADAETHRSLGQHFEHQPMRLSRLTSYVRV